MGISSLKFTFFITGFWILKVGGRDKFCWSVRFGEDYKGPQSRGFLPVLKVDNDPILVHFNGIGIGM